MDLYEAVLMNGRQSAQSFLRIHWNECFASLRDSMQKLIVSEGNYFIVRLMVREERCSKMLTQQCVPRVRILPEIYDTVLERNCHRKSLVSSNFLNRCIVKVIGKNRRRSSVKDKG